MVLSLFLAQFLYSEIFAAEFPDPEALAAFFAAYLAVTNLIEIALELWVTPWLIRHHGVPSAQLLHPTQMLTSIAALAIQPGVAAGVAARAARALIDVAVAQPIRSLVCNALPLRLRGRLRAFLEGVVVYAGMAAAGGLLLALDDPPARVLAAVGGGAALLYLGAGTIVRREYVLELESAIRTGRLDLSEVEGIGRFETEHLAEFARGLLREETRRPSPSLLRMLPQLAEHGALDLVRKGCAIHTRGSRGRRSRATPAAGDLELLRGPAPIRMPACAARRSKLARHPSVAGAALRARRGPDVRRAPRGVAGGSEGIAWLAHAARWTIAAAAAAALAREPGPSARARTRDERAPDGRPSAPESPAFRRRARAGGGSRGAGAAPARGEPASSRAANRSARARRSGAAPRGRRSRWPRRRAVSRGAGLLRDGRAAVARARVIGASAPVAPQLLRRELLHRVG
jgi:hypothetical protein